MDFEDFGSQTSGKRIGLIALVIVISVLLIAALALFFIVKPMLSNGIKIIINNTNAGDSGIGVGNETNQTSGEDFISYELLDENGNPIPLQGQQGLSIVQGAYNVQYIILTVTASNTGNYPLTCKILSVTPSSIVFKDQSLDKICSATGAKKVSWTTNPIDLSVYEMPPTPDVITVSIRCTYFRGTSPTYLDKNGTITLKIINQTQKYVQTRLEASAIGYADECGGPLTAYGMVTDSCDSHSYANCPNPWSIGSLDFVLVTTNASRIPNKPSWADPAKGCFYVGVNRVSGEKHLATLWQKKYNGGTCAVAGYWGYRTYNPSSGYASSLSTTSELPIPNSATESYCFG